MWLQTMDEKELRRLVWMFWKYENRGSWAMKHIYDPNHSLVPSGDNWVEGGYGTDCDHDFESLLNFIDYCL